MSASECFSSVRSLSEISDDPTLRFTIDLVAASRRNLAFLRLVSESQWLHHKSTLIEAIRRSFFSFYKPFFIFVLFFIYLLRCENLMVFVYFYRYDQLWMPLIADLTTGSKPPMILPPLDIEWVWFCHTINPVIINTITPFSIH